MVTRRLWLEVLLLSCLAYVHGASEPKPTTKPCTIKSLSTGSFFDLRPLELTTTGTKHQSASNESYHAKGYDYHANFTINFCGSVVEKLEDVEDVSDHRWTNVSAFYKNQRGTVFSIGQQNSELVFRGKKLVMNYTMGSYCPELDEEGMPIDETSVRERSIVDGEAARTSRKTPNRRKSTLLSFVCDTSPLLTTRPAISFVGTPDHCTYVFEVRSRYACAGATAASGDSGTLGPGGVFVVILGITFLVYLIGGVVYQRNVMHQRGWKQLPNYAVWAGLFGFISDMFVILFSSCTQRMPSVQHLFGGKRGYHRVGSDEGRRQGRGRTPDDENRLIDQLDEEWED